MMDVDLRHIANDEDCKDIKEVASKIGVQVVCSDEDEKQVQDDASIRLNNTSECYNIRTVASKVGVQVVCDEEE